MPFPIIPIVLGVGVVAMAAGGKSRGKAKGHYDRYGTHENLLVPRNLAGLKFIGTRPSQLPLLMVSVAAGTTPAQGEETAEVMLNRADANQDMTFFWAPDFELLQRWIGKKKNKPDNIANTILDPSIGLRLLGATDEGDGFALATPSGESGVPMIDDLINFANTGDSSVVSGYSGRRRRGLSPGAAVRTLLV